jgi:hypothetical protein
MKIDGYTKVVLTGIAVFLGFIAFDYKPNMKAEAGIMGGSEMISSTNYVAWHLRDGKIRVCQAPGMDIKPKCYAWSD